MKTQNNHCGIWDDALGLRAPKRGRWGLALIAVFGLGTAACDAGFVDLRDEATRGGLNPGEDFPDAGFIDVGTNDGVDEVVKIGSWGGRADYSASGEASVVRLPTGQLELRFSEDFTVDRVPGPVVVLTNRPSIGRQIDPAAGDVELGRLQSTRGAQTYSVPAGVEDRMFAWVYCDPFGIEVARAQLEDN